MSYPLQTVIKTCQRFAEILQPHCEPGRFFFAGSIRREHKEVKDIEIVCLPKKELKKNDAILFDEGSVVVSPDFIHGIAEIAEEIIKGNPDGRYMQIKTKSRLCPGIKLDLFMPQPDDFFRQLVIRTGSRDYVHHIIASAWVRKGYVGAGEDGLRKKECCIQVTHGDHLKWKLLNPFQSKAPAWQSEEEFFNWLGLQWIPPKYREHIQKSTKQ